MAVAELNTSSAMDFVTSESFALLKKELAGLSETAEYLELDRYFKGANEHSEASEKVLPVKLFQQALDALVQRMAVSLSPAFKQIHADVGQYTARLERMVEMLSGVAEPVPKIMHFVWVGGSEVGVNQRDYINIWRQVLKAEGYRFNLWYDSDALLAFETNKVIVESARLHAMENGGAQSDSPVALSLMIEERARVLKRQMAEYLAQPQWANRADEARIELLVNHYGKDRATLQAFRKKCLDSHLAMADEYLRLRDVRAEFADHYLHDVYQRELALRGNFAAASDVARLQAEYLEGGRYSDMDYLPPLRDSLGGVDVSGFKDEQRIGLLQLLLNHDDGLMPGRDRQRYRDTTGQIPAEHREALLAFAQSKPGAREIFVAPKQTSVPLNGFRMGTSYGNGTAGEMNAHTLAHPGSQMVESVMQQIRHNYDCLYEVERQLVAQGIGYSDQNQVFNVTAQVIENMQAEGRSSNNPANLARAISEYYQDGIRVGARGTIDLTGPGASAGGLIRYVKSKLLPDYETVIRNHLKLGEGYNIYTEEEMISGWTVNGDSQAWLMKEKEKFASGKLVSRYAGNLTELLKENTLTFKRGWPVVEGRPVLSTPILQHLLDQLGEPFIRAMNDRLSGEIAFNRVFSLSLEQRQQIAAQGTADLPRSIGAEALNNFNETLTLIAADKLPMEHLSPLHRVVLGDLFGAGTLDDKGFALAWEKAGKFARDTQDRGVSGRYEQLVQTLRDSHSPAFTLGLDTPSPEPALSQRSAGLKAQAFVEPLSTRQWGEHVARIEAIARNEYRSSILQRGGGVRQLMSEAKAVSAKLLPQDLLLQGAGDPGRRCYPLALTMAAALEKGYAAQRTLVGRMASAGIGVNDPQSAEMLLILDELRSVPMAEFGEKRGAVSLATVMDALVAKSGNRSLMINTDNHSMLVARVVDEGRSEWLFYDPNFGLYAFEQSIDLHKAIERFLAQEAIAGLYGIGEGGQTPFNLIELDGRKIAERILPSKNKVGNLLNSQPLVAGETSQSWQHHAALHTRALSENARLGRGIAQVEGVNWAFTIDAATRQLSQEQKLPAEFVPLYDTVRATADGKWTLTLINAKNPEQVQSVVVEDARWAKIKNWLSERLESMVQSPQEVAPHEPAGTNTLNVGFAMLALMHSLRQHEEAGQTPGQPSMTLAVRLHTYVVYSQLLHGVASDVVSLIKLGRQALLEEGVIAATTSSVLGRSLGRVAGEGAGSVLALANVGFDIYELVNADNEAARTVAAVQLSFDLAGVALGATAAFAGGTTAAVAGPLSVVVGGIAYGVGALAGNYLSNLQRMKQVGVHFYRMKSALSSGGFTLESGVFRPKSEIVIQAVNLQTSTVSQGSHFLFRGHRSGPGLPSSKEDYEHAININQRWKLTREWQLIESLQSMVLPCTPTCYYAYDYQLMPGGANRHDLGFDELRELEKDDDGDRTFWFDPWTPFEYLVYKLFPHYKPTQVDVVLDTQCRELYVPQLPEEWHGLMTYTLRGQQGRYSLSLTPGLVAVHLLLPVGSSVAPLSGDAERENMQWLVRADWANETAVHFVGTGLTVDGIKLLFEPQTELTLLLKGGKYLRVDMASRQLTLLEVDLPDDSDVLALTEYLTGLEHAHRLASPYVPLQHFTVPFSNEQWPTHTTACFDAARQRILYARDVSPGTGPGLRLGAVMGDQVYFFHADWPTIWRVDALTGKVNRRYRLCNPAQGSKILSCYDAGGVLHITQQVTDRQNIVYEFEYLLQPDSIELNALTSVVKSGPQIVASTLQWPGGQTFMEGFDTAQTPYDDDTLQTGGDVLYWKPAAFVGMRVHQNTRTWASWVRVRDDWFVSDQDLGLDAPVLLAPRSGDDSSMIFYEAKGKKIWRREQQPVAGTAASQCLMADVESVISLAGGYLAQNSQGQVFDIRQDSVVLRSLSEQWLRAQDDWLTALEAVAKEHRVRTLDILGLTDAAGRPLAAQWLDGQVLLVGEEQGQDLRSVGSTGDRKAMWLFAKETGRLLRQPLLSILQMRKLFKEGARSAGKDFSHVPQREWPTLTFTEVKADEGGLIGYTVEGTLVELRDGETPRLVGMLERFYEPGTSASVRKAKLQQWVATHLHAGILTTDGVENTFSWYDTANEHRFFSRVEDVDRWPVCLGTRDNKNVLLHHPRNGEVFSNLVDDRWGRYSQHDVWAVAEEAWRTEEVLTLVTAEISDLLPLIPDGVSRMVIGAARQSLRYAISLKAWLHLDCLTIDVQPAPSLSLQLFMGVGPMDHWVVSSIDGHLLLTNPDDGRSLIVRNARLAAATAKKDLFLTVEVDGQDVKVAIKDVLAILGEGESFDVRELLQQALIV